MSLGCPLLSGLGFSESWFRVSSLKSRGSVPQVPGTPYLCVCVCVCVRGVCGEHIVSYPQNPEHYTP